MYAILYEELEKMNSSEERSSIPWFELGKGGQVDQNEWRDWVSTAQRELGNLGIEGVNWFLPFASVNLTSS